MLEVSGLHVRYGPIHAVRGVSIRAEKGGITAILGANGAGKSSLMKAVSGLAPASEGTISIDGQDITSLPAHQRARMGISHAMEGRRIFHRMTVEENLRLAWDFRNSGNSFAAALDQAYSRFPVLAERRSAEAGLLSGGQQQMLILSAALMHQPRYLLLDEPSLGLAPLIVQQIFEFISSISREQGTTILLSEQLASLALRVASHGYVMRRGTVVQEGTTATLQADEHLSAAYLGA